MSIVPFALTQLLSISLPERISAVTQDLRSRQDRYRATEPHALANALGVPESRRPGEDGWRFTAYAEIRSLEDYAAEKNPPSELVYALKGKVSAARFSELETTFAKLDGQEELTFDFLDEKERLLLEVGLARDDLQGRIMNGISAVARFCVPASDDGLWFEAVVEDDGACIELRTPYDRRDGKFAKLENCVTQEW
jgi:hypothetical protein